ncbi:hypothetical protein, conserved [Trypanosoma brucei gambiense DAL972]|uniref:Uncharacterized protein n=1 Tax=Trypanosoma brucei gambiense (strain MHOM/CI/86/DAL972) TaxID=679716 RepID=D0A4V6_TRYB9|nr:hypothetical protein, conserved [Trypanosoma brucei gambiense DAL972]CBH16300.1 hypothetical protein, conserved [Trypanosoma brucei gambiense DAL972]|eukprot:XP_011778564.1 hypothetical protein, conserved [Trypanosoma brucei gambiense DAL972]
MEYSSDAVLNGYALLVWCAPSVKEEGDTFLRAFFLRRFQGTVAASPASIVFATPNGSHKTTFWGADGEGGAEPPDRGSEAMVFFREREGVKIVLSGIVQRILHEKEPHSGVELLRGYVFLGTDRLLVEGVFHPMSCAVGAGGTEVSGRANTSGSDDSLWRRRVCTDSCSQSLLGWGQQRAEVVGMGRDETVDYNRVTDSYLGGGGDFAATPSQGCDNKNHSDPQCSSYHGKSREHNRGGRIVLRVTFVCLLGRCKGLHEGGHGGCHSTGVSTHVVFKLLRGTCFPRGIIMFPPRLLGCTDGVMGGDGAWGVDAVVEVEDAEAANSVVDSFDGSLLELVKPGPNSDEVEFRFRLFVREDRPGVEQKLSIPFNTESELSITPSNLLQMGGSFRCEKYSVEPADTAANGRWNAAVARANGIADNLVGLGSIQHFSRDLAPGHQGMNYGYDAGLSRSPERGYDSVQRSRNRSRGRSRSRSRSRSRRRARRRDRSRSQHRSRVRSRSRSGRRGRRRAHGRSRSRNRSRGRSRIRTRGRKRSRSSSRGSWYSYSSASNSDRSRSRSPSLSRSRTRSSGKARRSENVGDDEMSKKCALTHHRYQ